MGPLRVPRRHNPKGNASTMNYLLKAIIESCHTLFLILMVLSFYKLIEISWLEIFTPVIGGFVLTFFVDDTKKQEK